jgi:2-polyprenyl-3-methyl-5-hydroxy-6-metoxy-1,4-benzoquinol methylase
VFREQPVTNRICKACGLVFQSPRLAEAELEAFYERQYRQLYQGEEGPIAKDLSIQEKRAEGLLAFLRQNASDLFDAGRPKALLRHLDIGCSAGSLLKRFREGLGTHPVGVEPGEAYRSYARDQGLSVYATLHDLQEAFERPFDLVSLVHVLEHLPDPAAYLVTLRESFMSDNALLLLEVPNLYAHDSFEVAHLVSFSAHTLAQVVLRAGYELLTLHKHGRPRSRLIPLYITVLARPALMHGPHRTVHLRPEGAVALKRRLGMLRRKLVTKLLPQQAWLPY